MLNYQDLYNKVKDHFLLYNKEERFNHSIRVIDMALKLNNIHQLNIDEETIKIAGLVHDYAKVYSEDVLIEYIKKEFPEDLELLNFKEIFHSLVGDSIIKNELKIIDNSILDAVKYHTTGKSNMNDLTKLIYLADYIEVGRTFKEASIIREIAYKSLDQAIYKMTKNIIKHLENNGFAVYSKTYETYNYYKKENLDA